MRKWIIIICIIAGLMLYRGKGCRNVSEYYANLPYIEYVEDSE